MAAPAIIAAIMKIMSAVAAAGKAAATASGVAKAGSAIAPVIAGVSKAAGAAKNAIPLMAQLSPGGGETKPVGPVADAAQYGGMLTNSGPSSVVPVLSSQKSAPAAPPMPVEKPSFMDHLRGAMLGPNAASATPEQRDQALFNSKLGAFAGAMGGAQGGIPGMIAGGLQGGMQGGQGSLTTAAFDNFIRKRLEETNDPQERERLEASLALKQYIKPPTASTAWKTYTRGVGKDMEQRFGANAAGQEWPIGDPYPRWKPSSERDSSPEKASTIYALREQIMMLGPGEVKGWNEDNPGLWVRALSRAPGESVEHYAADKARLFKAVGLGPRDAPPEPPKEAGSGVNVGGTLRRWATPFIGEPEPPSEEEQRLERLRNMDWNIR